MWRRSWAGRPNDISGLTDPLERHWTTLAILLAQDPATIMTDAEAALAAARAIGGPTFIAYVLLVAQVRWRLIDPPRPDRARGELDEATRLSESVGTQSTLNWVGLAWAMTIDDDPRALPTLKEALLRSYDERTWALVDASLEVASTLLAHDSPTVAATIHGHLEHSKPLWGHIGNIMRAMATELVNAIPDADIHRARGATMDRHEIVALTLATLEQS